MENMLSQMQRAQLEIGFTTIGIREVDPWTDFDIDEDWRHVLLEFLWKMNEANNIYYKNLLVGIDRAFVAMMEEYNEEDNAITIEEEEKLAEAEVVEEEEEPKMSQYRSKLNRTDRLMMVMDGGMNQSNLGQRMDLVLHMKNHGGWEVLVGS